MTRVIDLVSYLPPFLARFKEISVTLDAQTPEFVLVWNAAERVLKNEFIETADEYGISRFEKLLHIFPSSEDTIESRRSRVQIRWFSSIPYTWRVFVDQMIAICGKNNFTLIQHFVTGYLIQLEVSLELYGQIEELKRLMDTTFPCNIVFEIYNNITARPIQSTLYIGGTLIPSYTQSTLPQWTPHTLSNTANGGGVICSTSTTVLPSLEV